LSGETKDIETYLHVRDNISKYQLNIDITSTAIKNKMIEINTQLKFEDKEESRKKASFEIVFATIIKVNDDIKEKKELQKIILCDVQIKIYPDLEKCLLDLLHNSGYSGVKFEKKIDFENLYNQRFN
jgi:preprotein translocase subunit SecB